MLKNVQFQITKFQIQKCLKSGFHIHIDFGPVDYSSGDVTTALEHHLKHRYLFGHFMTRLYDICEVSPNLPCEFLTD